MAHITTISGYTRNARFLTDELLSDNLLRSIAVYNQSPQRADVLTCHSDEAKDEIKLPTVTLPGGWIYRSYPLRVFIAYCLPPVVAACLAITLHVWILLLVPVLLIAFAVITDKRRKRVMRDANRDIDTLMGGQVSGGINLNDPVLTWALNLYGSRVKVQPYNPLVRIGTLAKWARDKDVLKDEAEHRRLLEMKKQSSSGRSVDLVVMRQMFPGLYAYSRKRYDDWVLRQRPGVNSDRWLQSLGESAIPVCRKIMEDSAVTSTYQLEKMITESALPKDSPEMLAYLQTLAERKEKVIDRVKLYIHQAYALQRAERIEARSIKQRELTDQAIADDASIAAFVRATEFA